MTETTDTSDQIYDLLDSIELGEATEDEIDMARRISATASEAELLTVDPFNGDVDPTVILSDSFVRGRKPWTDHWTGYPIEVGERHRCIVERGEDGLVTTRHSRLSLWILSEGHDPSGLKVEAA